VKVAEVQNMARHVIGTGAVIVRAALESDVQHGRGDKENRQTETANLTKCKDLL
jgi:hypothetical protein